MPALAVAGMLGAVVGAGEGTLEEGLAAERRAERRAGLGRGRPEARGALTLEAVVVHGGARGVLHVCGASAPPYRRFGSPFYDRCLRVRAL